jgi:hypothetical protein
MAGSLPVTYYLLSNYGTISGEFPNLLSIAHHLGVSINDEGYIQLQEKTQHPSYFIGEGRNDFTKNQAIADWMIHHRKLPMGMKIRRCLR